MTDPFDTLQIATAVTSLVGNLALVGAAAWLRARRPGFMGSIALFSTSAAVLVAFFQLALPWTAATLGQTAEQAQGAAWMLGTLAALCDLSFALALVAVVGSAVPKLPPLDATPPRTP